MSTKKTIAQTVWDLAEPLAVSLGYSLWDVEYVKEGADWVLRITLDIPGALSGQREGISIEDCEKMHHAIDPILDEADPIEGAYLLEVSSPGLERTITRPEHLEACRGLTVTARCFTAIQGSRIFTGVLRDFSPDSITLAMEEEEITLPKKAVSKLETVYAW